MFTKRQLRILELIIRNSYGITSTRMAEVVHVSSRTIRSEIVIINSILKEHGFSIKSSSKKGYYIDNEYYQRMCQFIRPYLSNSLDEENRVYDILGRLLFDGKQYFLDMTEEMALTEQTLYKECQKIKDDLQKYYHFPNIVLKSDSIEIRCEENQKRRLLLKMMKELVLSNRSDYLIQIELLLNDNFYDNEYQDVTQLIKHLCLLNDMDVDDKTLEMISIAFYIIIIRNRCQFYVDKIIKQKAHTFVVLFIEKLMEHNYEISLADGELLENFCWGMKFHVQNEDLHISSLCQEILNTFCQRTAEKYHIYFQESEEVLHYLSHHIEYMIRRMETEYELKNPILYDIKKMYPVSYEISIGLAQVIYHYLHCYPNDDELSYITIYIEYFLNQVNKKIKVVIVSEPRPGLNYMIENWLKTNFTQRLDIVGFVSLHTLSDFLNHNHIDLVISTRRITETIPVPHYVIEGVPYKRDFELLNSLLHRIKDNSCFEDMVKKLFHKELIHYYQEEKQFEDIIQDLSQYLYQGGYVESQNDFFQETIERENMYSTIINRQIAIPHPLENQAKQSAIAVGILKHPVKLQHREIKVIFLLALESKENKNIVLLLDFFRRISVNRELTQELVSSHSTNQFLEKIIYLSKNLQ